MKIDLVKLVEEVYKLEGEPKNVNKVFALTCLQAYKKQLTLTSVSQQRELLSGFKENEYFDLYEQGEVSFKNAIEMYLTQ